MIEIPHLRIESLGDGIYRLENESLGDSYTVDVHLIHLRLLAEMAGLVPTSDPAAARTIFTLQRRLRVLHGRIQHLAEYLRDCSDHEHAVLDYERDFALMTADLAGEFIADLEGLMPGAAAAPASTDGTVEGPQPPLPAKGKTFGAQDQLELPA